MKKNDLSFMIGDILPCIISALLSEGVPVESTVKSIIDRELLCDDVTLSPLHPVGNLVTDVSLFLLLIDFGSCSHRIQILTSLKS